MSTKRKNACGKKWLSTMTMALAVVLVLSAVLLPVPVHATGMNGTCGDHLTWELSDIGVLTISGAGKMPDYETIIYPAPWYQYSDAITSIVIEDGVTNISNNAFFGCGNVVSVTIPNSVVSIGSSAFKACYSLPSIDIPQSVKNIGEEAFVNCNNLTSIVIPDGNKRIGANTFYGCISLTSVIIPETVVAIGHGAFLGCQSLVSIKIPNNVKSIEDNLFYDCISLSSVVIPDGILTIRKLAFFNCDKLTSVQIPASVKAIGEDAFLSCDTLADVYYAGSLDQWKNISINDGAFRGCSDPIIHPSDKVKVHKWNNGVVTVAPNCQQEGSKTYTCTCGITKTEILPVGDHVPEVVPGKPATCTQSGITDGQKCSICGRTLKNQTYIPAKGHSFGEWVVTQAPTGTTEGVETRTCSSCGKKETRRIPALKNPFVDVSSNDYYFNPVLWAVNKGITAGITPNKFGPNNACTRGQIVTFLWANAGSPEPKSTHNPFTDVKTNDYFYKAVLWAVENHITSGITPNQFAPDKTCTRAQTVTFLWAAKGKPIVSGGTSFSDVATGDYFEKAVRWAVANKITEGVGNGMFGSNQNCTRGQIVTFLYNAEN